MTLIFGLSKTFQELATRQHRRDNGLSIHESIPLIYYTESCEERLHVCLLMFLFLVFFSVLSKIVSSEIPEIKEIRKDIA